MKLKNISFALLATATLALTACGGDDLDGNSIFKADLEASEQNSELDQWLNKNYRDAYNIKLMYRYVDNESDRYYNVIPADYDKAKAIAILVKQMWLDAYTEVMGADFLKTYAPRIIQLTGSYKYQQNESGESGGIVMGTAEGGIKVMLYGVNSLDIDNPYINTEDPYSADKWRTDKFDMNHWFFHTMHHEFCHILTQKKDYTTEFRAISASDYHATDWINVKDKDAASEGFVTGYASGEYNEDFAEIYATYVTMQPEAWQMIIDNAGEEGAAIIEKKLALLRDYFNSSWNLDIDVLRDVILRRSAEVISLDLRNLK
ncbi:MAG: putative zinc-binding metallopeptidase [Prevotella sp.]|nr:putative zinc-binding metallopeptidase [Prevotella sp.]